MDEKILGEKRLISMRARDFLPAVPEEFAYKSSLSAVERELLLPTEGSSAGGQQLPISSSAFAAPVWLRFTALPSPRPVKMTRQASDFACSLM